MAKKAGRPTVMTKEVLDRVFREMAEGASERAIFRADDMPDWSTWCKYKIKHCDDSIFISHYAHAKELGLKVWEQDILEISDDESRDYQVSTTTYEKKDGTVVTKKDVKSDNTAVSRDKLRVDARKWLMSKMASKVYSDKVQQEVTGKDGAELQQPIFIIETATKPEGQES